jgi:hypothetical protein
MQRTVTRKRSLPTGSFVEHGFGRAPIHRNLREIRRMAVTITLQLFDADAPEIKPATSNALATVAELFQEAGLEDSNEWYTIHKLFGQPSAWLCLRMGDKLLEARSCLSEGDAARARDILYELHDDALPEMLESYLNTTKHQNPTSHDEPDGWAYVLWSSDEPDGVIMAATELTIDEAIAHITTPRGHPLGVLAAWQVYRPEIAAKRISALYGDLRIDGDMYVVERGATGAATLGSIKDVIETMLVQEQLLVRSPWHFEERPDTTAPRSNDSFSGVTG